MPSVRRRGRSSTCAAATAARARVVPPRGARPQGRARRRRRRHGRRRLAAWPTATSRRCSRSATTRTARPTSGTHGSGKKQHGASGDDLVVDVPEGTVVRDRDGELLADLVHHGDRWLAARGGRGGRGNARFLSNARRAPSFAEQGEYGEERWLRARAQAAWPTSRSSASPTSGKSHADLARSSAAKPKIADYPFTTLEPNLGVVRFARPRVRARRHPRPDRGRGRGQAASATSSCATSSGRACSCCCSTSRRSTAARPRSRSGSCSTSSAATGPSCSTGRGSSSAARPTSPTPTTSSTALRDLGGHRRRARRVPRPARRRWSTRRAPPSPSPSRSSCTARWRRASRSSATTTARGGSRAAPAERAVALADLTNPEALAYVQQRLQRLGVEQALARAGARDGDVVRIGDRSSSSTRRRPRERAPIVAVVKVGTSSITDARRASSTTPRSRSCATSSRRARADGHEVVLVMLGRDRGRACPRSGCTRAPDRHRHAAGDRRGRPAAADASASSALLGEHGIVAGQVLLTPYDFVHRTQYLHARETLQRLLDLGVRAVVNENDTVADDEIRYGDNDRLAALVAAPRRAPTCSCCSPTPPGCSPPIPRLDADASLIEEIVEVDDALEARRRRRRHRRGGAAAWRASSRPPRSRRGRACAR